MASKGVVNHLYVDNHLLLYNVTTENSYACYAHITNEADVTEIEDYPPHQPPLVEGSGYILGIYRLLLRYPYQLIDISEYSISSTLSKSM
jgi:hypothetical protein